MRPYLPLFLALACAAAPRLGTTAKKASADAEVKEVAGRFFRAINEGDIASVLASYHADAAYLSKNHPAARGRDAIAQAYRALFAGVRLDVTHVILNVSVGDLAIVDSEATGTVTVLGTATSVPVDVKELLVLRKIDGRWLVDRYMFSDNKE